MGSFGTCGDIRRQRRRRGPVPQSSQSRAHKDMLAYLLLLPLIAAAPFDARQNDPATNPGTPVPAAVTPPPSSPSPSPPSSSPPVPTYPATFKGTTLHPHDRQGNILKAKCLDVRGANFADGTPVQM